MAPLTSKLTRLVKGDLSILFYMSLAKLSIHLLANFTGGYGLFRDELYYMACAENLAAGYVDHPPLSVFILHIITTLFGDSLFVIRLVPAITGAITVFITGLIVIRLGGNKWAQFIACLCSMSLINFAMHTFYSMNSIDFLIWASVAYVMLLIIQRGERKHWIWLGVVLGVGLLNKISVLFLGAGIFIGLLLTKERKWLLTPWPHVTGCIAFILFLPFIIWNIQNDFAHLEFIHNASSTKYSGLSAIDFLLGQILINNPFALLIWIPGLLAIFLSPVFKGYRVIGFLYFVPLLIFVFNGTSKSEYLAPAYVVLWAAGGVWVEQYIRRFRYKKAIGAALSVVILIPLVVLFPMVMPVLPVEKYIAYSDMLGLKPASSENKELGELPQFYADMFGWKEKANDVAEVFHSLSKEDQAGCAIFGDNYGHCGAIDYYGRKHGLPPSIGTHNNYWIWGTRNFQGKVMIVLGGNQKDLEVHFYHVERVAVSECKYCMPYENNVDIFVCRNIKVDLDEVWPGFKSYN